MATDKSTLKFFADYIQKELGIIYSEQNYFQLEKRLLEIAKNLNFKDLNELLKEAQGGIRGSLKQLLLDTATNNETSFFRDPKLFTAFENHIIPEVLKNRSDHFPISIWCAASSFGQEPYTLAIILDRMKSQKSDFPMFKIDATDVSERALERASQGKFSQLEVQRGLPATLLVKYFTKIEDDFWQLKPEVRKNVSFSKLNLLDSFSKMGKKDVIFCRNVLIYQKDEQKKEIISRFCDCLKPKGIFVLGASESLIGLSDRFNQVLKDGAVYYQLKD